MPTDFSRFQSLQTRRFCCQEYSGLDLRLTPHLHLVPRLGDSGAEPPPACMTSGYGRTVVPFLNYGIFILHAPRKFHRLKVSCLLVTIVTVFMLMIHSCVHAECWRLSPAEFEEKWLQDNKTYFCVLPRTDFVPPLPPFLSVHQPWISVPVWTQACSEGQQRVIRIDVCRQVLALFILCNRAGGWSKQDECDDRKCGTDRCYKASLTFSSSTFCPHSVFVCFVWIWEQTAIISLYRINWLVFITETENN